MMVTGSRDSDVLVWNGLKCTTWSPTLHPFIGRDARSFVMQVLLVAERIKRTVGGHSTVRTTPSAHTVMRYEGVCEESTRGVRRDSAGSRRSSSYSQRSVTYRHTGSQHSMAGTLPALPTEMWLAILSSLSRSDMVPPSTAKPPGRRKPLRSLRKRMRRLSNVLLDSLSW